MPPPTSPQSQPEIIPLLLTPSLLTPTPQRIPLLTSLLTLINASYGANHFSHPHIFDTTHVRAHTPQDITDIPGHQGFTIVLLETEPGTPDPDLPGTQVRVLATGSVKDFGPGSATEHVASALAQMHASSAAAAATATAPPRVAGDWRVETVGPVRRFEVTAFGVDPGAQGRGLGARVMEALEWIVSRGLYGEASPGMEDGVGVRGLRHRGEVVEGIDMRLLRGGGDGVGRGRGSGAVEGLVSRWTPPVLVLTCIVQLGMEKYYSKLGFRTTEGGKAPVGLWGCIGECDWVYMEKGREEGAKKKSIRDQEKEQTRPPGVVHGT
ncbi:hypothetical protein CAC42_5642 [Sphaceloma murrayae]|uniref:Uncharacterized protein n=1 Tax=Sphaceloma murrayae TaxID=2082308 RepID=A0A2K1QYR0_9PEZI|nr:hypothetical protein CAC42_5642 [Sphaceloma murrayae]